MGRQGRILLLNAVGLRPRRLQQKPSASRVNPLTYNSKHHYCLEIAKRQLNFFGGVPCVVLPLRFSFVALVVFVPCVVFPSCVSSASARRFALCSVVGCRLRSPSFALRSLSCSVVRSVGLLVAPSFVPLAWSALRLVLRSCFVALGSSFVLLRVGCPSCRRFSSFGCRFVRLGVGFSHTLIKPIDKLRLLIYNLSVPDGVIKHFNSPTAQVTSHRQSQGA